MTQQQDNWEEHRLPITGEGLHWHRDAIRIDMVPMQDGPVVLHIFRGLDRNGWGRLEGNKSVVDMLGKVYEKLCPPNQVSITVVVTSSTAAEPLVEAVQDEVSKVEVNQELLAALEAAQGALCASRCPTTWVTAEGQPHCTECANARMTLLNAKGGAPPTPVSAPPFISPWS